ncbi:MAG: aminotransferase class IV [Pirellulaceae bacterium]|nr:aminotransferase class IV [Pirellulaceae bacterium]
MQSPLELAAHPRMAFCMGGLSVNSATSDSLYQSTEAHWTPLASVSLSLEDWGLVQGATLVERLRTVGGKPLDVGPHLDRLRDSAKVLGIQWPDCLTESLVMECVERNRPAHTAEDFAIVILLTPGRTGSPAGQRSPTVIVHSVDLHWAQLAHWYRYGQALITADTRNVPGECWSTHLKTRSRLHYYLADQAAARSSLPYAGAAMLSIDGYVTESSVANILMVEAGQLISPPIDSVLHGLSLRRTLRLAEQLGIPIGYRHITRAAAQAAEALMLTGSSGCLWAVSQLDDTIFADATTHSTFSRLREAWIEDVGIDYVSQAYAALA